MQKTDDLIPRKVLFGNPDRSTVRLSPDGRMISFIAPLDGTRNVWVAPRDRVEDAEPVTRDTGRGIQYAAWTHVENRLIYIQDEGGDENWRVYAVDVKTKDVTNLTPYDHVQARVSGISPDLPEQILVQLNDRDPRYHDVYRISLLSGARELVLQNDRFVGFVVDHMYEIRYGLEMTPDGGSKWHELDKDGWKPVDTVSLEDALSTWPSGLTRSGDIMYLIDSRGRDTAALIQRDLATGDETVLYEDPKADVTGIMRHPYSGVVQAARSEYERQVWHIIDPAVQADFDYLETLSDGELGIASRTLDEAYWIVTFHVDTGPVRYYLYDRKARQAVFLFTNREDLEDIALAPMHPVVIPARDGLPLVSYLTLPLESDPDQTGRPKEPQPLVLVVHGGPWARDSWGFSSMHQWLANRGYAVLSVNYRGSTGFGKAFINAGNGEWGAKMHDDLLDAVDWAVDEGIARRDKVAIMGGSYGGYAALAGLTLSPDVFVAAVDIVGPSNLVTLLESIPPYWEPQIATFTERVGDHRTEEGRALLRERSPLTYVDRIKRPLLIAQGANDPRVKQAESDQIVMAMQERAIPVTYVLYPDEGHGFARPENNRSFFAVAEGFLAEHLGGRCEPIGSDFVGSSIMVQVGAEYVPGLVQAVDEARA